MHSRTIDLNSENRRLFGTCYAPEGVPRAVIQILHGMLEHQGRYADFSATMARQGIAVYIHDHHGHGKHCGHRGDIDEGVVFGDLVTDAHAVTLQIKQDYPDVPIFLLGHSMGSFIAQLYFSRYPKLLSGLLLSGTSYVSPFESKLGIYATHFFELFVGMHRVSYILTFLVFGLYNRKCKPKRSNMDWISRDNQVVDQALADPHFPDYCTVGFFRMLFSMLHDLYANKPHLNSDKESPIYFFAGDKDPVSHYGKTLIKLVNDYKKAGYTDITCDIYKGGRHEMLNEINRTDVYKNIQHWIEQKIQSKL